MFNRVDAKKMSGIDNIAIDTEFELFWHIFLLLLLFNKIIITLLIFFIGTKESEFVGVNILMKI